MHINQQFGPDSLDDVLCGLPVYSSDLVPLGQVADVETSPPADRDTIDGRCVTVEPNPTVRFVLDGRDLVISESMIFHADPTEDRVILNLPARRVIRAAHNRRGSPATRTAPVDE
jgi:hypothetical protein